MARRVVIGDLRVQQIQRSDGRRSWTIVWPEGTEHAEADRFLRRHEGSGTQRTYAYVLVDHLRWLERDCLTLDTVRLRDLERYMGILGAEVRMPLGEPWRVGKRPYGPCGTVDHGVVPEGFLPAPGRAGGQPRAWQEPQPDSVAVAAGSPPQLPGSHNNVAAGQSTCPAGSATAASEDAARRRAREATGGRVFGSGPARGELAW